MARKQEAEAAMNTMGAAADGAEKEVVQKKYDEAAVADRFKKLNEEIAAKKAQEQAREEKLAKVAVAAEDVELVMQHLNLPKAEATRKLREHGGDATKTFAAVIEGTA